MSQIERMVYDYLMGFPEIRKAYQLGLINRRALARRLIKDIPELKQGQFENIIATLRRLELPKLEHKKIAAILPGIRIVVKDKIAIINLVKSKELLKELQGLIAKIDYDKNETFKIVVGTSSVKVFIDEKNLGLLDEIASKKEIIYKHKNMSELSLLFPENASESKGIISHLSSALTINDIVIEEMLSCSPELLLYIKEEATLKTYEVLKKMQKEK